MTPFGPTTLEMFVYAMVTSPAWQTKHPKVIVQRAAALVNEIDAQRAKEAKKRMKCREKEEKERQLRRAAEADRVCRVELAVVQNDRVLLFRGKPRGSRLGLLYRHTAYINDEATVEQIAHDLFVRNIKTTAQQSVIKVVGHVSSGDDTLCLAMVVLPTSAGIASSHAHVRLSRPQIEKLLPPPGGKQLSLDVEKDLILLWPMLKKAMSQEAVTAPKKKRSKQRSPLAAAGAS